MIVVDTSAIVAVLFGEDHGAEIERRLIEEPCVMSAATRVELGIVIEAKTGPAGQPLAFVGDGFVHTDLPVS